MSITDADIQAKFPFSQFRPDQLEAVRLTLDQFDKGKKFVIIEMPVGCGKSAIAYSVAQFFANSYYLTIQRFLQDQLMGDFGQPPRDGLLPMVDLKGRGNYQCTHAQRNAFALVRGLLSSLGHPDTIAKQVAEYFVKNRNFEGLSIKLDFDAVSKIVEMVENKPGCDKGVCRTRDGKSRCKDCFPNGLPALCPYWARNAQAQAAQICLMNFRVFLHQTVLTNAFGHRDLMIVDECFHPHTNIVTDRGRIPIGKLVNKRIDCSVLSYNKKLQKLEFKPISRFLKRGKRPTFKVIAGNRVMYPTADHKIHTPNGLKKLCDLRVGDLIIVNEPEISHTQQQILLGSLLGDASVQIVPSKRKSWKYAPKGARARVRFVHSSKQLTFLRWKYNILKEHVNTGPKIFKSKGFSKRVARFNTKCNMFEQIKVVIRNHKKTPNKAWFQKIEDLGLAVWFMDDGSCNRNTIHLHTEGYTLQENRKIAFWLRETLDIPAKVLSYCKRDHVLYYITLGRSGSRILAQKIARFIPPFMRYKLPSGQWDPYNPELEVKRSKPVSAQPVFSINPYKETVTYDLEVADNHNYFAGSSLVSNCHQMESELMNFIGFSLNDKSLREYGIVLSEMGSAAEYARFLKDKDILAVIENILKMARAAGDLEKEDEWMDIERRCGHFLSTAEDGNWVALFKDTDQKKKYKVIWNTVELKPVYVRKMAHDFVFNRADKVLMMSATVLSAKTVCSSLGIETNDMYAIRYGSRFPVENRPILFTPVGSLSYKNKAETLPKIVPAVDKILNKYKGKKGIIHTHNFEIARLLISECETRDRMLFQEGFENKKEMLKEHAEREDSVIVAPAMHEGLDLKDELSRFQIIVKMPYPPIKGNPQLEARMQDSQEYYDWLTALKLVQATGRSVRSETDWAHTYILDADFEWFLRKARGILPKWFKEAIRS